MTEKNKGGRPIGSKNKTVLNRTKLLQEAIDNNFNYDLVVNKLKEDFFSESTSVKDRLAILQFIAKYDVLTSLEFVSSSEDGEIVDHSISLLQAIQKLK